LRSRRKPPGSSRSITLVFWKLFGRRCEIIRSEQS
jgi:hypothetical protein